MKINVLEDVNGMMKAVTREMTAEEAEYMIEIPQGKTDEERIADLEKALAILLGGETDEP